MKTALITGTSSGIGYEIAQIFLKKGYRVIGLSRTTTDIRHENFSDCIINLTNLRDTEELINKLVKEHDISILVNNAGIGYYGLAEEINTAKLHEMITVNLEIPVLITSLLLRSFKKNHGVIINISSVTAHKSNPHGAAYGATKAGLSGFSDSIFDEARKHGVRVITIEPDMTDTNLYRHANFSASPEEGCHLKPSDVANAVDYAISSGCVTHITLKPQFHRIARKGL